jgi:regulator of protease activity HflC (stomatin/prohibitin superfamily)
MTSRCAVRGSLKLSILVVSAIAGSAGCATVGPGQRGVLWTASGGTETPTYEEGLHVIAPWNDLSIYDLRSMSHDEVLDVIAVNGLGLKLDASVRYHLNPSEVVALQKEIGPDYYTKILEPMLRSEARRVFGRYTPEDIYSTKREIVEREIREGLLSQIEGKHIVLEAILIRDVVLPDAIQRAIDQKLAAEQEVLKMKYVVEVARAAADVKRIEAQGIYDYNHIVSTSLSSPVLEFERIEQLSKLAASANAKTVVIGERQSGTPLLLSTPSGSH